MTNKATLFLTQSYHDAWDDYIRSLTKANFAVWDYVILTASNEEQAEGFRAQLAERRSKGLLPTATHFAVVPDPSGLRVGSGGATLGVLRYIAEKQGSADFGGLRILVIHSGGDSKRVPQYSAIGKLFSPVPHELPNGRASTLFDEFIIGMSSVPSRIREGMLLLSGDVLLLFNSLQIDYQGEGAAAISFKENVETGKNHGVFLRGEDGYVKRFLHKQTVESLQAQGAVNERGAVDIDTGAVIFSSAMLASLYGLISEQGVYSDARFAHYVNETVRLSLYADFLYPLATDSTLDDFYLEKPEGEYCDALTEARRDIWNALRPYRLKLLRLAPAKFVHFGTTGEILHLMSDEIQNYAELGWTKQTVSSIQSETAGYNSVLSEGAKIGKNVYLEVSYVHERAEVGENTLLSYVDIYDEKIPPNVVLHGLKQRDGRFVARIYGVGDNPKAILEEGATLFGKPLTEFLQKNGISCDELWESGVHSLWTASLYPACKTIHEAVKAALNLYELAMGQGNLTAFREAERKSLALGFNQAEPTAIIAWDARMQELVRMDRLYKLILSGESASKAKAILATSHLSDIQREWLERHLQKADFSEKIRLNYYVGTAIGGTEGDTYIKACFDGLRQSILDASLDTVTYRTDCHIACDRHTVELPLRVNFGGGWSDTPPYCNEKGGTVLNAALLLNGEKPVSVTLERLDAYKIVFDSRDMDVHGEFDTIEALQQTGDPYDSFALQKAALIACGILPRSGGNLREILERLGGGFRMNSEVTNVPKGSGLGTSSILSGACVKAIFDFMGIAYTEADLYRYVLCMEQIMATGGGWQDQVGGLTGGLKYITTEPGLVQEIKVSHIALSEKTERELNERFALIYTGQRRLARNLLRDVVGRYVGNESDTVFALNEIQRVAALMRFELERGHVDDFACLMKQHWELSKQIDRGSTNTLIDRIFGSIADLIDGQLVCGAGGGGFLQVIMKKGVTKNDLHERLKDVFEDNDVDVFSCTLDFSYRS